MQGTWDTSATSGVWSPKKNQLCISLHSKLKRYHQLRKTSLIIFWSPMTFRLFRSMTAQIRAPRSSWEKWAGKPTGVPLIKFQLNSTSIKIFKN
jgi:hypothetical protein